MVRHYNKFINIYITVFMGNVSPIVINNSANPGIRKRNVIREGKGTRKGCPYRFCKYAFTIPGTYRYIIRPLPGIIISLQSDRTTPLFFRIVFTNHALFIVIEIPRLFVPVKSYRLSRIRWGIPCGCPDCMACPYSGRISKPLIIEDYPQNLGGINFVDYSEKLITFGLNIF